MEKPRSISGWWVRGGCVVVGKIWGKSRVNFAKLDTRMVLKWCPVLGRHIMACWVVRCHLDGEVAIYPVILDDEMELSLRTDLVLPQNIYTYIYLYTHNGIYMFSMLEFFFMGCISGRQTKSKQ